MHFFVIAKKLRKFIFMVLFNFANISFENNPVWTGPSGWCLLLSPFHRHENNLRMNSIGGRLRSSSRYPRFDTFDRLFVLTAHFFRFWSKIRDFSCLFCESEFGKHLFSYLNSKPLYYSNDTLLDQLFLTVGIVVRGRIGIQ